MSALLGAVFAAECAHIHTSEGGATEFFTGGAKITTLPAPEGRLSPDSLDDAIGRAGKGLRFRSQPDAISITNGTELGTVYSQEQVATLADVARRHGLKVHMDGARFANAIASLNCSPADLTWRLGVDILSLGMTKNSAMGVDLVVCALTRASPMRRRIARGVAVLPSPRCALRPRRSLPRSKMDCGVA